MHNTQERSAHPEPDACSDKQLQLFFATTKPREKEPGTRESSSSKIHRSQKGIQTNVRMPPGAARVISNVGWE